MAEPLAIIGTAGAIVNVVDGLAKIISTVAELRSQWKDADLAVATFETQLIALNAALAQIKAWADNEPQTPHHQLTLDLDRCVAHCKLLVGRLDQELASLHAPAIGRLDAPSKLRLLFQTPGINDIQKMIKRLTSALNLLLTACSCNLLSEQNTIVQKPNFQRMMRKIDDDATSLTVHRDADSCFRTGSSIGSSKRSLVFEFDKELLVSSIYQRWIRGSVRRSLRKQQGEELPRILPQTSTFERSPWEELYRSIQTGDNETIALTWSLTPAVDLNYVHADEGETLLTLAIAANREVAVGLLLRGGADIQTPNRNGETPLIRAVARSRTAMVKYLLQHGALEPFGHPRLNTALYTAASLGACDIVTILLDHGADVQIMDSKTLIQFLDEADSQGQSSVAALLLTRASGMAAYEPEDLRVTILKRTLELGTALSGDGYKFPAEFCAELLREAVRQGHTSMVNLLLEKGANINLTNSEGESALHIATTCEFEDIVQLLLEKGAAINLTDCDGRSALHIATATMDDYEDLVKILLEKGADINLANHRGLSALHIATRNCNTTIVRLLLEKGADINLKTFQGSSALCIATSRKIDEIVQLLLEKGADINLTNSRGWSALHIATRNRYKGIIRLLLEKGAHINLVSSSGSSALSIATICGFEEIVQLLLEKGADMNLINSRGWCSLHFASARGFGNIVQLLLENGAEIDSTDHMGRSALHMAAGKGSETIFQRLLEDMANIKLGLPATAPTIYTGLGGEYESVIQLLLENGADINLADSKGWSALHFAAASGFENIVRVLLENGANINLPDHYGWSALHLAASEGYTDIIRLLLDKGADINLTEDGGLSMLHIATGKGFENIVRFLLDNGADINLTDRYGWSALHTAANEGFDSIVQLLLLKGANIYLTDTQGHSALDVAATDGFVKLILDIWAQIYGIGTTKAHSGHELVENSLEETVQPLVGARVADRIRPLHHLNGSHLFTVPLAPDHQHWDRGRSQTDSVVFEPGAASSSGPHQLALDDEQDPANPSEFSGINLTTDDHVGNEDDVSVENS